MGWSRLHDGGTGKAKAKAKKGIHHHRGKHKKCSSFSGYVGRGRQDVTATTGRFVEEEKTSCSVKKQQMGYVGEDIAGLIDGKRGSGSEVGGEASQAGQREAKREERTATMIVYMTVEAQALERYEPHVQRTKIGSMAAAQASPLIPKKEKVRRVPAPEAPAAGADAEQQNLTFGRGGGHNQNRVASWEGGKGEGDGSQQERARTARASPSPKHPSEERAPAAKTRERGEGEILSRPLVPVQDTIQSAEPLEEPVKGPVETAG
ncbi:hypothetical protein B0J11DRAFT_589201 [Dendryphion nanum]|uniref:Uncharacterized protein n=1 Tax=Dendryphion nanum TaxID=256645 RepID=A0A9P9ELN8_9PLEO|nr:hypothetical protein B0J11DRAFT_589201 [Dendryphion nanum]